MKIKNWRQAMKILKDNKVFQGDVARAIGVSTGYVSKITKQKESFTPDRFEMFNEAFKGILELDESLIISVPANSSKPGLTPDVSQKLTSKEIEQLTSLLKQALVHQSVLLQSEKGRQSLAMMKELVKTGTEREKGK
jgi:transcriptional regulator with XRE-family HTH domain